MGLLPGWANISLTPRILEDQRCERPARAGPNCVLSTTNAVGEPDAGSLHRSNHWLEPETCDEWYRSACRLRPSTRHTNAQQTMANQNLGFIVNRPRGHAANSVPYLTPPVLVNIPAFL